MLSGTRAHTDTDTDTDTETTVVVSALPPAKRPKSRSSPAEPQDLQEEIAWRAWAEHLGGGLPLRPARDGMRALLAAGQPAADLAEVARWAGRSGHDTAAFLRDKGLHRGITPWRPSHFETYLDHAHTPLQRPPGERWKDVGAPPLPLPAAPASGASPASKPSPAGPASPASPTPLYDALPYEGRCAVGERVLAGEIEDEDEALEIAAAEWSAAAVASRIAGSSC